jgi:hypothetical protein
MNSRDHSHGRRNVTADAKGREHIPKEPNCVLSAFLPNRSDVLPAPPASPDINALPTLIRLAASSSAWESVLQSDRDHG